MTRHVQLLCGTQDPETTDEHVGDPVTCDFLRDHDGPCSWAMEREALEDFASRECSTAELDRMRLRRRAVRRIRKAG